MWRLALFALQQEGSWFGSWLGPFCVAFERSPLQGAKMCTRSLCLVQSYIKWSVMYDEGKSKQHPFTSVIQFKKQCHIPVSWGNLGRRLKPDRSKLTRTEFAF